MKFTCLTWMLVWTGCKGKLVFNNSFTLQSKNIALLHSFFFNGSFYSLHSYISPDTLIHTFLKRCCMHNFYSLHLTYFHTFPQTKCRKLFLLNDLLVCVSLPSNRLKFAVALQEIDIVDDVTPASNNLVANSVLKTKGTILQKYKLFSLMVTLLFFHRCKNRVCFTAKLYCRADVFRSE